ncbi:5-dehydro-4-deoxy-D-glucuronate isomerase [Volucribacter amazonae]|uniref:4-deoxy-L-threo-5-hexosulose-uronate ketol-isomerase n=1 Tax=Volucribacter amazonae TaxID=256731 RepID=A0A9X4PCG1_9PAST|nr:5-dehydro-4-deoxy-D-glucuronate isomerase [Volucribacter amazonae]MDG6895717.1 5-dehydro-4-deoxy-D-glucuronate isomerase [Volucribacter amazonae]
MKIFHNFHPEDVKSYDTQRLRKEFFEPDLFVEGQIRIIYSHIDRIVALGVCPKDQPLALNDVIDAKAFGTDYFLQRRELGIINLGGKTEVKTKDDVFILDYLDALYLGKESEDIVFTALEPQQQNALYCLSAPAHHKFANQLITQQQAKKVALGSQINANQRVINQYLHPDVVETCQLCMGITHLAEGSVWNTMPAHTHLRRMEVYLYFNIKPEQVVFHFLGEPEQTRHIVVRDKQLVFSPSWSIHSGCGTQNYSFIWGMIGENQTFDDMDFVDMNKIC